MDVWIVVVTAVASLAAVASAVVAVVEARSARRSETDAVAARDQAQAAERETLELSRVATAAFIRQAEAQERANRMREDELKPSDWVGPRHLDGDMYRVVNTSGRTVVVEQWDIDPEKAEPMIHFYSDGMTFEYGQSFDFMYSERMGLSVKRVTIVYRFADEMEGLARRFLLVL